MVYSSPRRPVLQAQVDRQQADPQAVPVGFGVVGQQLVQQEVTAGVLSSWI